MANIKISQLPNSGQFTANTLVPVVQNGINYAIFGNAVQAYVNNGNTSISITGNIATAANVNVGNNISVAGNIRANTISTTGNITTSGFFVGNFSGNITGNLVVPGANTQVLFNNAGNAGASPNLVFNSATSVLSATGNIAASHFLGNGALLTGLPATYSNANVTSFLPTYSGNLPSLTGNIITTGNITGAFLFGNGASLTGIVSSYSNANVASYLPTYTGNLPSMTGNIITTGNITGAFLFGNGSQLTGLGGTYSNANVAAYMPTYSGNLPSLTGLVSTTGNVSANFVTGNASLMVSINGANVTGRVPLANIANTVSVNAQPNITSVGNLTGLVLTGNLTTNASISTATMTITGNSIVGVGPITLDPSGAGGVEGNVIIAGNLQVQGTTTTINSNTITINNLLFNVANNAATASQANGGGYAIGPAGADYARITYDSTANVLRSSLPFGQFSVVGNVTANFLVGNGTFISSIAGSNVIGQVANASVAGTVTTAAQPNITSVGNLTAISSSGNITTTGNISGNFYIGNGSLLTGIVSSYGDSNVATYLPTYTGNLRDSLGNVRTVPITAKTAGYALAATDNGQCVSITTGGVTVPSSIMAAGDVVTVFNNSTSNQTITQGIGLTLRWAGQTTATTGSRTIGQFGLATVIFISPSVAVISGSGLS